MVALAVYDAVMAVEGGYQPYAFHAQPPPWGGCPSGRGDGSLQDLPDAPPKELVLEITEQQTDGGRFERHLVLERVVLNK